jgi:6-phosphogluconolactonase (cycloisomerase 2 family)/PKD repeat protein
MLAALLASVALGCPTSTMAARTLFVSGTNGSLFGFGVGGTGSLSWLQGFPVANFGGGSSLVPAADGTHLYATLQSSNAIRTFSVSSTGGLAVVGQLVATGLGPSASAVTPSGSFLFVANTAANTVSSYRLASESSPTSLGSDTPVGAAPDGLAISPDGSHLFVANGGGDSISTFEINADGSLGASGPDTPTGKQPAWLALTPDGSHLYVANRGDGTISGFAVAADGSLGEVTGSPFASGGGTSALAIAGDGSRLVAANTTDGSLSRFTIGAQGTLSSRMTTVAADGADSVGVAPNAAYAFAAGGNAVTSFTFPTTSALASVGFQSIGTSGNAVTLTPDQSPTASFFAVRSPAGQTTRFEGGGSSDADGHVAGWRWDFGDGTTGTGSTALHTYANPGEYTVRLTVTDDEGCSADQVFTGQSSSCTGDANATVAQRITIDPAPVTIPTPPPCSHDGNDGFCGTPDQTAPRVTILGINNGASISTVDAPDNLVGEVTPDPAGIAQILLRFTKADGTITTRRVATRRVCTKRHGKKRCRRLPVYRKSCRRAHGRRRCTKHKLIKVLSRDPACLTVSGAKNYLVRYRCAKVPWVSVPSGEVFRYELPVTLGVGSYTVEALATDGAGNSDVLEDGRNRVVFKINKTSSNQGADGTGTDISPGTTTSPPINDTGSPFG